MNRRVLAVSVLVALVLAAFVLDAADEPPAVAGPVPEDPADGAVLPVAGPATELSSTWFCAGGSADEEAFADHVVTVLNPGTEPVTVTVGAVAGVIAPPIIDAEAEALDPDAEEEPADDEDAAEGPAVDTTPVVRDVEVAAASRVRIALSDLVTGPVASAVVEAPVGGLVVEHEVASIHGADSKPCSTWASDTWHFAWGTTARQARELLVLFNPFPDDAIVDGRFSTEDGVREPVRFDGLVVPARSTLAVDLGDDVTRRDEVAATITTRTGRLVVDRILRVAEDGGDRGLTVQLGVSHPQTTWLFADGFSSETVRERYVVYNPSADVAEVSIELLLDRPDENGIPEPFDLSLPPGTHVTVDVSADGRVPDEVAHAAVVRSDNDVGIVVERVLSFTGDSRRGISTTTGSPVLAETWTFAAGAASSVDDEWITIYNPDPVVLAEVSITAVVGGQRVPVSEMQDIVIEAGERVALRLGERIQRDDLAIVVTATEPVVAERGRYHVGEEGRGTSNAVGIPDAASIVRPGDPLEVEVDADLGELEGLDDVDDDDVPVAPDDVELPTPDETIVIDDPDAEADTGSTTSTTSAEADGDGEEPTDPDATSTTSTTAGGVPDTTP